MSTIRITSGDKEIFFSGSVITYEMQDTTINLEHNGEALKFIFKFEDKSPDHPERGIGLEVASPTIGIITFYNYTSSNGTFSTQPINLGSIGGHELYFQYRIDDLQACSKLFFYTFYLGQEVENGSN